ncbi:hypothetical protein [uncultured Marixanthomonas sp.]|uniref:hypothetical protein n=1 Tax=uncultured Marixanthomonas sp. TaxID=757245 RepID=UPI0030D95603
MSFSYTYQDWKEGKILWNGVDGNWHRSDYIAKGCIAQINSEQEKIFEREAKLITERLLEDYVVEKRTDTNRETTIKNTYKTVENLLGGDVNSFNDTSLLFETRGDNYYELSDEIDRKLIPPRNWDDFDESEIRSIQDAYENYKNRGDQWNYKTVQTPIIEILNKHIDYIGEVNAKAYLDYSNHLRKFNGEVYNSFDTHISEYRLSKIRSKLKKGNFIDERTNSIYFERVFQKKYIFRSERINWIGTKQSLRCFIQKIETSFEKTDTRSKWGTLQNCFIYNGEEIEPDTIRKAKPTKKSLTEVNLLTKLLNNFGF